MNQVDFGAPVLACCGFSGSGKTTLLEAVIPVLCARGLRVAVVKHDAHGVQLDRPGKDSDRLFRAGADVVLRGANESAARWHVESAPSLDEVLADLTSRHDLVLVEGHKDTSLPKLWLLGEGETAAPTGVSEILEVLPRSDARIPAAMDRISAFLKESWHRKPVSVGILIGGRSSRMGSPKQMLVHEGQTLVERVVNGIGARPGTEVLLGSGEVPETLAANRRLSDAVGLHGPLAGLMAALRWAPKATWLMVACDQPLVSREAIDWLMAQRRPGRWAIMPRLADGPVEPFLAVYEPQALTLLEEVARTGKLAPWRLAEHDSVASPQPPSELVDCWRSVNTPEDFGRLSE